MNQSERRIFLIRRLLDENPEYCGAKIPESEEKQRLLLRGLFNIREPKPCSDEFTAVQDEYLTEEIRRKGVTNAADLSFKDGICLWQGDITALACDAIVNAANSGMTGCYIFIF